MRVKIIEAREYNELKKIIKPYGRKRLARRTGITYSALNLALNGFRPFTIVEIKKIQNIFPDYKGE